MNDSSAVNRRRFLKLGGSVAAAGALAAACKNGVAAQEETTTVSATGKWGRVRSMFDLDPAYAQFGGFLFASHPKPVRDAIEGYRRRLDRNPVLAIAELLPERTQAVRAAAADFIDAKPGEIAMTDSTTMGLGLVYGGMRLREGQEILTTHHDHYSSHQALSFRAKRMGASFRKVALFDHSARASENEIVSRLMAAITERTRVLAVTWVHSMSGLRLPIPAIAAALAKKNEGRAAADRTLLCVDGVHGFGAIPVAMGDFGADFFIAGTHKWVFGPRGTGLIWGRPEAWKNIEPVIPPFEGPTHFAWLRGELTDDIPAGLLNTPGGFHSFEHRWALPAAFEFQKQIGREAIATRIHALNRQLKEGLAKMSKVELFTPMSNELSAGITCFMVDGLEPGEVVKRLLEDKIIATVTPYKNQYARLAPGLLNMPDEVEKALASIRAMA